MQVLCVVLEQNIISLSVSMQNPSRDDSTPIFTDFDIKVEIISGSFGNISLPKDAKKEYQGVPSLAVELKQSLLHPKPMLTSSVR